MLVYNRFAKTRKDASNMKIKNKFVLLATICIMVTTVGCNHKIELSSNTSQPKETIKTDLPEVDITNPPQKTQNMAYTYIDKKGTTLKSRIRPPKDYDRLQYKSNSFEAFLANYALRKNGEKVLLYDGTKKGNQSAHIAIFDLPLVEGDLQQCADSIIRIYAEYFFKTKQFDKIKFHFVNGFLCDFNRWRSGMRVEINGNNTTWQQNSNPDNSYNNFEKYLRIVFSYASTLSMEQEAKNINLNTISVGDIFIRGGSPGHVVMVVDLCQNQEGKKAFLLAQGYMPAQQFHVLKNPMHEEDPWYYEDEIKYPFQTPEYSFKEGSLMRPPYNN